MVCSPSIALHIAHAPWLPMLSVFFCPLKGPRTTWHLLTTVLHNPQIEQLSSTILQELIASIQKALEINTIHPHPFKN